VVEQQQYEIKNGTIATVSMGGSRRADEDATVMTPSLQALVVLGWFQMVGWNEYVWPGDEATAPIPFLSVMKKIDAEQMVPTSAIRGSRFIRRPEWSSGDVGHARGGADERSRVRSIRKNVSELLPFGGYKFPSVEADMKLEYLPFAAAEYTVPGKLCSALPATEGGLRSMCGLLIEHGGGAGDGAAGVQSCSCWLNLPVFRNDGWLPWLIDTVAGWVKVPARVSTYWEMMNMPLERGYADRHVAPLRRLAHVQLYTCGAAVNQHDAEAAKCDDLHYTFGARSTLLQFVGKVYSPSQVAAAIHAFESL
jgi:hypothetical protein